MLANIKFKAIEDLKKLRAEEYDFNKFTEDSSDDFPKYADGIEQKPFVIKQADDDMNYQQAFSQDEVRTALKNVISLAETRVTENYEEWKELAKTPTADFANSIQIVKDYFFNSGEAVFNNSQIAQDNKD